MMMNISGATSGNGSNSSGRDYSRCPFTQTQWQELEHQALIYKYMLSGVPVPPELIYSVKRSLDSSLASSLFPHQPLGWGCFQVGIGRKADPEPGRCRRTDGKKWRCSKEAYPDSKYCERHMHRGRNRSRKPVESPSPSSSSSLSSNNSTAIINRPSSNLGSIINPTQVHPPPSSSSSNSSSAAVLSPDIYSYTHQKNPSSATHNLTPLFLSPSHHDPNNSSTAHQLFLESGSYTTHQPEKDYRYYQGIRDGVGERTFFPESSRNVRSFHETMGGTSTDSYKRGSGYYCYNQLSQYQSFPDESRRRQQEDQHCFVLGRDFKSSGRQMRIEKGEDDPGDNVDGDDQTQKPLHHFFGEWPPKNTDSRLDLASHSRVDS